MIFKWSCPVRVALLSPHCLAINKCLFFIIELTNWSFADWWWYRTDCATASPSGRFSVESLRQSRLTMGRIIYWLTTGPSPNDDEDLLTDFSGKFVKRSFGEQRRSASQIDCVKNQSLNNKVRGACLSQKSLVVVQTKWQQWSANEKLIIALLRTAHFLDSFESTETFFPHLSSSFVGRGGQLKGIVWAEKLPW